MPEAAVRVEYTGRGLSLQRELEELSATAAALERRLVARAAARRLVMDTLVEVAVAHPSAAVREAALAEWDARWRRAVVLSVRELALSTALATVEQGRQVELARLRGMSIEEGAVCE